MNKKKRIKKTKNNDVEIWTEEQYEEYLAELYDMEYVAGFTEGGVPYGIFNGEAKDWANTPESNKYNDDNEVPF